MRRSWTRAAAGLTLGLLLGLALRADADAPLDQYQTPLPADTATDTRTGLTWQRNVPPSPCAGSPTCTHAQALGYCQGLSLGGFSSGWRVPTVKELQTIVDERQNSPAIDPTVFPGTPADWFWSSSPKVDSASVWGVTFIDGSTFPLVASDKHRVRCVR